MNFPGKSEVVKQVQRSLALKDDGVAGKNTWTKIAYRLGFSVAVFTPDTKNTIIRRVQNILRVFVDGKDGEETWSAIARKFTTVQNHPISLKVSSDFVEKLYQTPNISRDVNGVARINELQGLVFHHAAGYFDGTISWCLNKASQVSYHCLINLDGSRAILAKDTNIVWHAGKSSFKGRQFCNTFTMGLSYIGNTNDGIMRDGLLSLTDREISSTLEWLKPRIKKYGWKLEDITHHRVISPGRKDDLSIACWNQLIKAIKTIL